MKSEIDQENIFNILYEGFELYQKKVNGYLTCANKTQIMQWEKYLTLIRIKYNTAMEREEEIRIKYNIAREREKREREKEDFK